MTTAKKLRAWFEWHSIRAHVVAPIWLRLPEKLRWRIVDRINRSDRVCWSDLVDAAIAYPEDDPCDVKTPIGSDAFTCRNICGWLHEEHVGVHDCSCYCGKFRFTAPSGSIERARR